MSASRRTIGNRRIRFGATLLGALSLVGTVTLPSGAYQRPGRTELISVRSIAGEPYGSRKDTQPSVSSNGRYVAFVSNALGVASSKVVGSPLSDQVYVRDRLLNSTELISVTPMGLPSNEIGIVNPGGVGTNDRSVIQSISANGRWVAFSTIAGDIVPGDTNLVKDVFVRDRKKEVTTRVSVTSDGEQTGCPINPLAPRPNHDCADAPSISGNGRFVTFHSSSQDLDGAGLYRHDRLTGKTQPVAPDTPGGNTVTNGAISGDGRFVVFVANDDDPQKLVENDGKVWTSHVYLRDLERRRTEIVSVTDREEQSEQNATATGTASNATISAGGRFVAFRSSARNLVPNQAEAPVEGAYVRDLNTGRTYRVSVKSTGEELNRDPLSNGSIGTVCQGEGSVHSGPRISPDGRFAAFSIESATACSIAQEPRGVVVYDLKMGSLIGASPHMDGTQDATTETAVYPDISTGGRFVVFESGREDDSYHPSDAKDATMDFDVLLHDRGTELGVGGFGGSPVTPRSPDDRICVTPDLCIPPGSAVSSHDSANDVAEVLTEQGANLYGASLAYRPQYEDLFVAIELEHMPQVLPGLSPIFYGLRFDVEDKSYEVRATSLLGGTFGLFDCTNSSLCTKVADLRGGYGTTGMRVVFSLPLDTIGLEGGGELSNVEAFSGIGSSVTGATQILDTAKLQ